MPLISARLILVGILFLGAATVHVLNAFNLNYSGTVFWIFVVGALMFWKSVRSKIHRTGTPAPTKMAKPIADAEHSENFVAPWSSSAEDEVVANFAVGNLRESLKLWVTLEGRIHAETLLVTIGAIAGFASGTAKATFQRRMLLLKTFKNSAIICATAGYW
jgi:hypothetical protein